jgi:hypothetical protein
MHYFLRGDYINAVSYLEKVERWPLYERIWEVNLFIATSYDKLFRCGKLEKEFVSGRINEACKKVIGDKDSEPVFVKSAYALMKDYTNK